jgi:hypothetical protein
VAGEILFDTVENEERQGEAEWYDLCYGRLSGQWQTGMRHDATKETTAGWNRDGDEDITEGEGKYFGKGYKIFVKRFLFGVLVSQQVLIGSRRTEAGGDFVMEGGGGGGIKN